MSPRGNGWLNEEDPLHTERVFVSRFDTAYFTVMSNPNMRSVDVGVKSIFFEMP